MRKFLVRLLINAIALYAAVALLRGSYIYPNTENWIDFIWLALIFGIVNAVIRPALMVMSCPLIILTLGLGTLIVNTAMFALAGWIGTQFGVGFQVNGFWGAFLGAIVVSVVSFLLSLIIREDPR
jgi:putative membrane protein